jgi:hypothetical protein
MKKLILLTLLAFIFFSVSSSFALTIKTPSTPHVPKYKVKSESESESTSTPPTTTTKTTKTTTTTQLVKQPKSKAKGDTEDETTGYAKCLNEEMKKLTKEMQTRKKDAWANYQNALKSATSTVAKK